MDCSKVQPLLSAYCDGELAADDRTMVAAHVTACAQCSRRLAAFGGLSTMVKGLATPPPPADIWTQIERELDADVQVVARRSLGVWTRSTRRLAALAALVVIAVGLGLLATSNRLGVHPRDHLARYLDQFQEDAEKAQRILIANYGAKAIDLEEAGRRLGYRPVVAGRLPDGYTLEAVYAVQMPCCDFMQYVCRRGSAGMIAIFERGDGHSGCLEGRPAIAACCGGQRCRLAQLGGKLVVSWNMDKRHLTIVGVRDVDEVEELMANFGKG